MKNYEMLEATIKEMFAFYEESFNGINEDLQLSFTTTLTHHKVKDKEGEMRNVAYFRVGSYIKNLKDETKDEENLIHNGYFPFRDYKQKKEEKDLWMEALYKDFLIKLCGAGLEYVEQIQKLRAINTRTKEQIESAIETPDEDKIQVTDKMPEPLNESEQEYKEWVKENNENS